MSAEIAGTIEMSKAKKTAAALRRSKWTVEMAIELADVEHRFFFVPKRGSPQREKQVTVT
jgi:hypothetical protein